MYGGMTMFMGIYGVCLNCLWQFMKEGVCLWQFMDTVTISHLFVRLPVYGDIRR